MAETSDAFQRARDVAWLLRSVVLRNLQQLDHSSRANSKAACDAILPLCDAFFLYSAGASFADWMGPPHPLAAFEAALERGAVGVARKVLQQHPEAAAQLEAEAVNLFGRIARCPHPGSVRFLVERLNIHLEREPSLSFGLLKKSLKRNHVAVAEDWIDSCAMYPAQVGDLLRGICAAGKLEALRFAIDYFHVIFPRVPFIKPLQDYQANRDVMQCHELHEKKFALPLIGACSVYALVQAAASSASDNADLLALLDLNFSLSLSRDLVVPLLADAVALDRVRNVEWMVSRYDVTKKDVMANNLLWIAVYMESAKCVAFFEERFNFDESAVKFYDQFGAEEMIFK